MKYCLFLVLLLTTCGCESNGSDDTWKNQTDQDKDKLITQLSQTIKQYDEYMQNGNRTMAEIESILDSIQNQTTGIDDLAKLGGDVEKKVASDRLKDVQIYIEEQEIKIEELTQQLKDNAPKGGEIAAVDVYLKTIDLLKNDLDTIKKEFFELKQYVDKVENDRNRLQAENTEITDELTQTEEKLDAALATAQRKQDSLARQKKDIEILEEEVANADKITEKIAKEYFQLGKDNEEIGDSYNKMRKKKKRTAYSKALENYLLAHTTGQIDATSDIKRVNYKLSE